MAPKSVAVLGGGITGLSAAFHLARRYPSSQITLIEKSNRLGGWIRSERVQVRSRDTASGTAHEAEILIEKGPRTLRPAGQAVLELANLLSLKDSIITTPKTSPAARNRFLYIPGTDGLTPLPYSPLSLLTSARAAKLLLPAILREPFRAPDSPKPDSGSGVIAVEDESFESLLSRRFGAEFARIFGSALVHGIYAADARQLSVRAAFPALWDAERRGKGSVVRGLLTQKPDANDAQEVYDVGDVTSVMADASVYSFEDGMETLPKAIERFLRSQPNVEVITGSAISSLERTDDEKTFKVTLEDGQIVSSSHLVSALPLSALSRILPPNNSLPHLHANPNSSVTVINIIFPPTSQPIHPPGFGYLVPRPSSTSYPSSLASAIESSTSGFLGTVFDSCALSAQDHYLTPSPIHPSSTPVTPTPSARFTKLTVMLGGPYPPSSTSSDPSVVLPQLARHLRLRTDALPDPVLYEVSEHKDCIPTPTVGHLQRVDELRRALQAEPWGGRLEVIGAGVTGVSVPDCVAAGRAAGRAWSSADPTIR